MSLRTTPIRKSLPSFLVLGANMCIEKSADCMQKRATLMNRSNSVSGYSVSSGSMISRTRPSSLSFHTCNA
uniref:Uncharacterized protein n=1 Tax=Solanum lycopersicum TaxID=4081 RepID=A0A3Q7I0W4_SOLLC